MGGLTSLLLLLCVGVTVSAVLDLQKRILEGHGCPAGEREYHVKFIRGKDSLICGGSLLKNNWILTAAHCWEWGMKAHIGPNPVMITALPVMYEDKKNMIHDIMLLELPAIPNLPKIKPVDLPDCKKQKPKAGDTVKIAGYAATTTEGDDNERETLQCADIKLSDCPKLKTEHELYQLYSYNHWFCGKTSTVDKYPGDTGGGVVFGNMIYGVISFMVEDETENTKIVGFMDVCEYKDWIEKTTKKGFFSFF